MAFCTNCGAQVEGRFCPSCGAAIGGGSAPAGEPVGTGGSAQATGLTDNVAGALAYLFIPAIIFLLVAPYNQNRTIRFHSFQSIFLVIANFCIWFAFTIVSFISGGLALLLIPIQMLIHLGIFILWIVLIVRAYNNNPLVLPVIGPMAQQQAG